jgi:hypothetical protein
MLYLGMSQPTVNTQSENEHGPNPVPTLENEISAEEMDAIRVSWSVLEPYLVRKYKEQGYSDCIGQMQSESVIESLANSGLSKEKVCSQIRVFVIY